MTSSQLNRSDIALGNLFATTLTAIGLLLTPQSPWFVGMPTIAVSTLSLCGITVRHRKHKLTPNDYGQGFQDFCDDAESALNPVVNWLSTSTAPIAQRYLVPRIPPIAKTLLEAITAERDETWLTPKMILASKFVLGGKGTGKSVWTRYEARRFKSENPEGILRIVDLHLNEEDGEWLPGLNAADYLAIDAASGITFVRELVQLGLDRIASKSTHHPEYKLIIDEFQGFRNRLSDQEQELLDQAIQFSQDELRKYRINLTLTSKSRKKGMTGQDSSVIDQMDFLALGNAIADPNNVLPYDIDAKTLTVKRQAVAALPGCKYACIYRPAEGEAEIKVIPADLDKRTEAITFALLDTDPGNEWLTANLDRVLDLAVQGKSKTAIAQSFPDFGKRHNENPRWFALSRFLQEMGTEN